MANDNRSAGSFLSNFNQQRFEQEVAEEIAADRNRPENQKQRNGSATTAGTSGGQTTVQKAGGSPSNGSTKSEKGKH